jgi:plasmid stabilization system protein ParE
VEAASAWDEEQAAAVEDAIRRLVAAGADEDDIRSTVRAAIRLGRRSAGD